MSRHTPLRVALRRPWPGTLRGLVLWLFALCFIALGTFNYLLTPPSVLQTSALRFVFEILPGTVWGAVMITLGLGSGWSSYCHHGRDRYGYVILATFCGCWGMAYITGAVLFNAGARAVGGSAIWVGFSAILVAVAGFPNVPLGDSWLHEPDPDDGRNRSSTEDAGGAA